MTEPRQLGERNLRRATRATAVSFVLHAAVSGTWAPRLPALKAQADLGNGALGLALFVMAGGLVAGTRSASALIDRHGSRPVLRAGIPLLCVALTLPALAHGLAALALGLLALGFATGLLDVAMNAQGVAVERRLGRPILNGFHGLWCVGLGLGAGVAALAAAAHVTPLVQFAVVGGLIAAISAAALTGLLKDRPSPPGATAGHVDDAARGRNSRAALVLGAIAFAAFCAEGSAMDWSAVYLREDVGAGGAVAATGLLAFSVSMALSRFAADRLAARIGSARLMRRSTLIAAAGLGIGLAVNRSPAAIAGFALFGAGLAPVVPTTFSAAGRLGGPSSSRLLGRVVTAGYVGSVLGPLIIGGVSQFASVRVALAVPVSLALAISLGSHAASGAREPSSAVHPIPAER